MPFNIGPGELIIVLIIALIVVGPGKLPDVGSALGKSIREFRKAATDVKEATSMEPAPAPTPVQQAPAVAPAPVAPTPVAAAAPVAVAAAPVAVAAAPAPVVAAPAAPAVESIDVAPEPPAAAEPAETWPAELTPADEQPTTGA
jgi:TatA/E family protein of Tat protein translocase